MASCFVRLFADSIVRMLHVVHAQLAFFVGPSW